MSVLTPTSICTDLEPVVDLVRDLFRHWNTTILLLGYTIYVDTTFALTSVINQLFTQIVRPSTLEFSLFSLTASLTSVAFALIWFFTHERIGISLRSWLIIGYSLSLLVPFWGSIGISSRTNVGFKVSFVPVHSYAQLD
jgi:hypothetical protein